MDKIIIEILKWALPIGGLSSVVAWLFNRTFTELRLIKESHDTFKSMYEDVKQALLDETEEKKQLRRSIGRFERAINKMFVCKHYAHCPVDAELKKIKEPTNATRVRGQPKRSSRQSGDRGDVDSDEDDPTEVEIQNRINNSKTYNK